MPATRLLSRMSMASVLAAAHSPAVRRTPARVPSLADRGKAMASMSPASPMRPKPCLPKGESPALKKTPFWVQREAPFVGRSSEEGNNTGTKEKGSGLRHAEHLERKKKIMKRKQFKSNIVIHWIGLVFLVTVAVLAAIPGHPWAGVVLYDVNFGSPPHTVGLEPAGGTSGLGPPPRDKVSRVTSNFQIFVTDTFGLLTDQPLEFNSGGFVDFLLGAPDLHPFLQNRMTFQA